jgi:hypothetical protein
MGPASSASILHSADNVLFLKLKLLHCASGRLIGGEIGSLNEARPRSKPSGLMSGRTTRGEIGVEEATELRPSIGPSFRRTANKSNYCTCRRPFLDLPISMSSPLFHKQHDWRKRPILSARPCHCGQVHWSILTDDDRFSWLACYDTIPYIVCLSWIIDDSFYRETRGSIEV